MFKLTESAIEDFVVLGSPIQETTRITGQVTGQVAGQVITLLKVLPGDKTGDEMIEMSYPDKPNSRLQKYRLTAKGLSCL